MTISGRSRFVLNEGARIGVTLITSSDIKHLDSRFVDGTDLSLAFLFVGLVKDWQVFAFVAVDAVVLS